MENPFRRYGFAAVVVGALALMAAVVVGRTLFDGVSEMAAANAPAGAKMGGPGGEAPEVQAARVARRTFSDAIQAIGTAQARESVVITPQYPNTIRAIRFESGDRVRAGQVLVEMRSTEQQADLSEARAQRDAAQRELTRFQELHQRGFASQASLDNAQAAYDAANARLQAGQSRIADRTIRAPFAGVVGLRTASPGQYVTPGTQLGTLDDISEIKLDFDVSESQLTRVAPGVAIIARTAAFPGEEFTGAIAQVDTRVAAGTRTVRVRAILPNTDERLRSGMLMTVEVRSNPREALAVPETAIIEEGDQAYVFTVGAREGRPTAIRTRIETGQRTGGWAEVLSGLREGAQIVTEGVTRVRPDQPVRIAGPARPAAIRGRSEAPSR
ncbi:MAG: efflux RND transporter periplasmic adaptor subunit [Hyphomonadaceae bacterium]